MSRFPRPICLMRRTTRPILSVISLNAEGTGGSRQSLDPNGVSNQ